MSLRDQDEALADAWVAAAPDPMTRKLRELTRQGMRERRAHEDAEQLAHAYAVMLANGG